MPLNRVSFCGKIMRRDLTIDDKIMRQGMTCKKIFRVLLKQWIMNTLDKIFMLRGKLLGHFYATGYRVWRALPRGKSLIFFRTPFLKSQKKSHTKITKSQKNYNTESTQNHKSLKIAEKSHENISENH